MPKTPATLTVGVPHWTEKFEDYFVKKIVQNVAQPIFGRKKT
jgi:hypothetical protein